MSLPTYNATVNEKYFIEALHGPQKPSSYLDNFPDEMFDTSPESRLYKFIYTLIGPVGVSFLKLNYFYARLELEEHGFQFDKLDKLYANPLRFARRFDESYVENWKGMLNQESWDLLRSLDESYRQRVTDYFHAARLGGTVEGMRFMARSAFGFDAKVIENYQHVFNYHSDQVLNYNLALKPNARGVYNTEQFTIIPNGYITSQYDTLTNDNKVKKVDISLSTNFDFDPEGLRLFDHGVEHLKPVNTLYNVDEGTSDHFELDVKSVISSSEFYSVTRFVTGNTSIPWPKTSEIGNDYNSLYWIEAGVEKETPRLANGSQQHFQGFYKPTGVTASSFAIGQFNAPLTDKYPMLKNIGDSSQKWTPDGALSFYPEPLRVNHQSNSTNTAFINGLPLEYMQLPNVPSLKSDQYRFWVSTPQLTNQEDYLEIDFGQTRAVNFIVFEILSAPLDISIYYDSLNVQDVLPKIINFSCSSGSTSIYTYETTSQHGLAVNDTVTISGIAGDKYQYYNGTFTVLSINGNKFTVQGLAAGLTDSTTNSLKDVKLERNLRSYTKVEFDEKYLPDENFDYDPDSLNKWAIAPYTFKNIVFTRFIKIKFMRNSNNYLNQSSFLVNSNGQSTPWPVAVKNLRIGRTIV